MRTPHTFGSRTVAPSYVAPSAFWGPEYCIVWKKMVWSQDAHLYLILLWLEPLPRPLDPPTHTFMLGMRKFLVLDLRRIWLKTLMLCPRLSK